MHAITYMLFYSRNEVVHNIQPQYPISGEMENIYQAERKVHYSPPRGGRRGPDVRSIQTSRLPLSSLHTLPTEFYHLLPTSCDLVHADDVASYYAALLRNEAGSY